MMQYRVIERNGCGFKLMIKENKQRSTKKKRRESSAHSPRKPSKKKSKLNFSAIKSQIEHTVNAKKIIKFIKNSTKTIPHLLTKEQSKRLLPKLDTIVLTHHPTHDPQILHFNEAEDRLTQSMVQFTKDVELESEDLWAIQMQTKKCYSTIPSLYFEPDLTPQELRDSLKLTKDPAQMGENVYELMDYLDVVQFNLNQQVGVKIRIFTNFVMCMDSLQHMLIGNTRKISQARAHTKILRDIIVSRSIRINQHRLKKQRIESMIQFLGSFRKMKEIEGRLYAFIETGTIISHDARSKSGALYRDYREMHDHVVLKFCCKGGRGLCKYWDLAYFVERGFQDQFIGMLKKYIFEVVAVNHDLDSFKRAHSINKKTFSTTPTNGASFSVSFALDESYEVDAIEQVELLVKENVEKQITALFEQGMSEYSFSTDSLVSELDGYLQSYLQEFMREVLSEVESGNTLSLKDLMASKSEKKSNYFGSEKFRCSLKKISWSKFEKIVQLVSHRLQHLNVRVFSITNKILEKALPLQDSCIERHQVICTYMMQLNLLVLGFSDESMATLIRSRLRNQQKSKQAFRSRGEGSSSQREMGKFEGDRILEFDLETENMKKIIKQCKRWQDHIQFIKDSYPHCKTEIDEGNIRGQSQAGDPWGPKMAGLKGELVRDTYENLHKSIITRELKQKLEDETWQVVEVDPCIYDTLGYILGGVKFQEEQDKLNRELMTNSLLLEKSSEDVEEDEMRQSIYNREKYSSKFRVNPMYVTLGTFRFKVTSSTEEMIKFLKHYLELYDETGETDMDQKYELQARITEIILMYNQYIKDLILKSEAVKLGKIKSKSITAKHLVTAYAQLQAVDSLFCGEFLQHRISISEEECAVMHQKLKGTRTEIRAKFMKILEMRTMITLESLNYKDDSILSSDGLASIPKSIRSSVELFQDFMLEEKEMAGFLDMEPTWVGELETKLNKAKSKERKRKVVGFLIGELSEYLGSMPRVKAALFSMTI